MNPREENRYATTEAVAGLASELDGLKRRVRPLHAIPGHVETLADRVEQLAMDLSAFLDRAGPKAIPTWIAGPTGDEDYYATVLGQVVSWCETVFMRYPDGQAALPDCWVWHPHVVEELVMCQHFWAAAYEQQTASAMLAADWHDRCRPGVVRRIREAVGTCSLENHDTPTPEPTVPGRTAVEPIAQWWAHRHDRPAPAPSAADYEDVAARERVGRR